MKGTEETKTLNQIFEEIESIRIKVSRKGSYRSLLKEEGGHIYSNGLFKQLDDDFSSISKKYPGMSVFS
jgi:hypothetical protein